jgi:hypothetical protein
MAPAHYVGVLYLLGFGIGVFLFSTARHPIASE